MAINNSNYMDYSLITPYIRYCEEDRYREPWRLAERKIGDHEFIFITRGAGRFLLEDRSYDVKAGDLILLKPNIPHSAVSVALPFEFLCFHFDLYVSDNTNRIQAESQSIYETVPPRSIRLNKVLLDYPDFSSVDNSSYIGALLKRIISEVREKQDGFNTVIKALFTDFIFNLFRGLDKSTDHRKYPEEIEAIIAFINSNYTRRLYLSEAAEHIHLHHTYVSALFKKHTGLTFSEYLTLYRLSAAKKLLLDTDGKIDEIACKVGFYDLHHFSKVFKAHEGISPSQYRQIKNY